LAFTGLGSIGQLLAVLGAILVLFGVAAYFVDLRKACVEARKAASWLMGW
jgi:hypothetical protein